MEVKTFMMAMGLGAAAGTQLDDDAAEQDHAADRQKCFHCSRRYRHASGEYGGKKDAVTTQNRQRNLCRYIFFIVYHVFRKGPRIILEVLSDTQVFL